jgi:hypothetical protein
MNFLRNISLIGMAVLFAMCGRNPNVPVVHSEPANKFQVIEVIQTTQYTYLNVLENSRGTWVAVNRQEITPGEFYYYDKALKMDNFHSKELERTFEVIFFVNEISKTPFTEGHFSSELPAHSGKASPGEQPSVNLSKTGSEITIGQIFENRDGFSGKEIEIRGVVVKVNEGIMGTNWIHLQDGTSGNGSFDLTVTSQDLPGLNKEVVFKGSITLDKDFGSGYFYPVIMENGTLVSVN